MSINLEQDCFSDTVKVSKMPIALLNLVNLTAVKSIKNINFNILSISFLSHYQYAISGVQSNII